LSWASPVYPDSRAPCAFDQERRMARGGPALGSGL
jgi:hypothetical protein